MALALVSTAGTAPPSIPAPGTALARVLIVTGGPQRVAAWREALLRKHFTVAIASPDRAARTLETGDLPDVILIDLADPAVDGLALCRRLRADGITRPVVMLHPLATLEELLAGFEAGADAYLRGWFEPAELLGHVGALCRRTGRC